MRGDNKHIKYIHARVGRAVGFILSAKSKRCFDLFDIGGKMAVQKSRVTRSKRGMRRAHSALTGPTLSSDKTTGETHLRHNMTKDGYYRGRQVVAPKPIKTTDADTEE